jgi:hypothetical protein
MRSLSIVSFCLLALTLGLVLPLAGCGDTQSKVTIMLTDAPGDFRRAVVTISRIEFVDETEDRRIVLLDKPKTTNLLTLANDTAALVEGALVPAGTYSELRFVITGAYVEVEEQGGGTRIYASSADYAGLPAGAQVAGELQMPSLGQSGLKVKLESEVTVEGEQKVLLVDFDVAQSFGRQAGGSGRWVMSPVIKAAEMTLSGGVKVAVSLAGGVSLPRYEGRQLTLGDVQAVLVNAGGSREALALTDADGNGVYEAHFKYLFPGSYSADLAAPVSLSTQPGRPAPVSLGSGRELTVPFSVTGAQ